MCTRCTGHDWDARCRHSEHRSRPGTLPARAPDAERPIDLGYRADDSPAYLGHRERREMAEFFQARAAAYGLTVDISLDPKDRFDETAWAAFLNRCKGQLGTEAGGDYFELDDRSRHEVNAYTAEHPAALVRGDSRAILRPLSRIRCRCASSAAATSKRRARRRRSCCSTATTTASSWPISTTSRYARTSATSDDALARSFATMSFRHRISEQAYDLRVPGVHLRTADGPRARRGEESGLSDARDAVAGCSRGSRRAGARARPARVSGGPRADRHGARGIRPRRARAERAGGRRHRQAAASDPGVSRHAARLQRAVSREQPAAGRSGGAGRLGAPARRARRHQPERRCLSGVVRQGLGAREPADGGAADARGPRLLPERVLPREREPLDRTDAGRHRNPLQRRRYRALHAGTKARAAASA